MEEALQGLTCPVFDTKTLLIFVGFDCSLDDSVASTSIVELSDLMSLTGSVVQLV